MKVLIVDDERHVVDAIVLLVPWKALGIETVLTACSVEKANEILRQERPQIAIIDVVIDDRLGTEILSFINELGLDTKAIVISGYDDYQYIRNMFVLGGIDYLLKPIEQGPLIQAIKTAMGQIRRESEREERASLSDYQRNLYRSLILMASHDEIYRQICEDDERMREVSRCRILYADCFMLPLCQEGYFLELNRLLDVLRQKLESTRSGILFSLNTSITDVVILLYEESDRSLEFIAKKVRGFNRDKSLPLCFGCSESQPFPHGVSRGLDEARAGADSAKRMEKREIIFPGEFSPAPKLTADADRENALFSAVFVGADPDVPLSELLSSLLRDPLPKRGEIKRVWDYLGQLYETWNSYFLSQYPDYRSVTFCGEETLESLAGSQEDMREILRCIFRERLETMSAEKRRIQNPKSKMQEIADYLKLNYNKKIQQAECARLFYLNKDHMCRKFKEEMGIGMVDYVNRIRIEKAKELLRNTGKTIQEISDVIGFVDQKYFSRQFKKETSLSPTEYRMQNSQPETRPEGHA